MPDRTAAEIVAAHGRWARIAKDGRRIVWSELTEKERAYLRGAYLRGADLGGAYLGGANMAPTKDAPKEPAKRMIVTGFLADFWWYAIQMEDGGILLQYGCESHKLPEWSKNLGAICKQHKPDNPKRWERAIKRLIAFVKAEAKELK